MFAANFILPVNILKLKKRGGFVLRNPLVEQRYKLPVSGQWLVNRLVDVVNPYDIAFNRYTVHVSGLATLLGKGNGEGIEAEISEAVDSLMDTPVKLDDRHGQVKAKWLSFSQYHAEEGIIQLRFDPVLKPWLLDMKERLSSAPRVALIQFKHVYAIKLYILLKPYEATGECRYAVTELKQALMLGDDTYKQYRDFKRWVLKKAQAELQKKADIVFEFDEKKIGTEVRFIEFSIAKNDGAAGTVYYDARGTEKKRTVTLGKRQIIRSKPESFENESKATPHD